MNKKAVQELCQEFPRNLGWRGALITIYSLQHFESMNEGKDKPYAHGAFYSQIFASIAGLTNSASRKTVLNHLSDPKCVICQSPVDIRNKQLDHIVPKYSGGGNGLENTMVLCKAHNSSKGRKDLLEWCIAQEWDVSIIPRNILCLYARVMWTHIKIFQNDKASSLPNYIKDFISLKVKTLPSPEYAVSLYGSTYVALGYLSWSKMNESE